MAKKAGFNINMFDDEFPDFFERFAALVAAHEREECAKVCDENADDCFDSSDSIWAAQRCAAAIRARGNDD